MSGQAPFPRLVEHYKLNLVEKKMKTLGCIGRDGRVETLAIKEKNKFKIHHM